MSKIIKITDEKETHTNTHTHTHTHTHTLTHSLTHTNTHTHTHTHTHTKQNKGDGSYSKRVREKCFCWAFKLGFLQLICKAFLIFKSNLELTLSIILKERELYEPEHVAVECRYLKTWDLLYFLIYSSILVLKWRQVSPV